MTRDYRQEMDEEIERQILQDPEQYQKLLNEEFSNNMYALLAKIFSGFIIFGLIFRFSTIFVIVYLFSSLLLAFYDVIRGQDKKAKIKIRQYILENNPTFKLGYDNEVLSSGLGSKLSHNFIVMFLIIFVCFMLLASIL